MLVTYAQNLHQIQQAKEANIAELILGAKNFSRFNKSSLDELNQQISLCHELNIKVILEWDILMTENKMESITENNNKICMKNSILSEDKNVYYKNNPISNI